MDIILCLLGFACVLVGFGEGVCDGLAGLVTVDLKKLVSLGRNDVAQNGGSRIKALGESPAQQPDRGVAAP